MPYVPVEVEDLIFDRYLTIITSPDLTLNTLLKPRSENLSNVALVCRRWRMRANAHRFADLELMVARTRRDKPSKIGTLAALIKTDTWPSGEKFAEFVQNVELIYDPDYDTRIVINLDNPQDNEPANFIFNDEGHIVSILDAIFRTPVLSVSQRFYYSARGQNPGYKFELRGYRKRHLHLDGRIQLQDMGNEIVRAIGDLCTTPFLSGLSLHNLRDLPPTLCSSPSLTNLHLRGTSFISLPNFGPVSHTSLQRLTTLSFDTLSDLTNLGFRNNPPSHLGDLSIISSWDNDAREAFKQVYYLSKTLRSLSIEFENLPRPIPDYRIRARLGQLTRLELTFNKLVSLIPQVASDNSSPMACLMNLLPFDHGPSIFITVNVEVILSEYYTASAFTPAAMYRGLDEVHAQLNDGPLAEYLMNNPNPYVPIRPEDDHSLFLNLNVSQTFMKSRPGDNPKRLSPARVCKLESYLQQKYDRLGSVSGTFGHMSVDASIHACS